MRIEEMTDGNLCPCDSKKTYAACCKGCAPPHIHIPDSPSATGTAVPIFAVFRDDGTAAIVFSQRTFCMFVHPEMPMRLLDEWMSGKHDVMPDELRTPWEALQTARGRYADGHPTIVSDGRTSALKFIGSSEAALWEIVRAVRFPCTSQ
jgi:hypothetical protein